MPTGEKYGIAAQIRIVPSAGETGWPSKANAQAPRPIILDTRGDARGLVSVTVTNSIDSPHGQFQLQFAPEAVTLDGLSWNEAVAPYSLVTIALHRYGHEPAGTLEPEPVMIGIVDRPAWSESYSSAAPQRSCTISGRGLAAVLTDHRWWTHHWLTTVKHASDMPADLRRYFLSPPDEDAAMRNWGREQEIKSLGLFALDPELFLVIKRHPVDVIERTLGFYLYGITDVTSSAGPRQPTEPFIKVSFLDGTSLADRLFFDAAKTRKVFVDPLARLDRSALPTSLDNATCWQAIRQFVDEQTMEIFSETHGRTLDDAYAEIVVRKKPWAGQIAYHKTDGASVAFASGRRPQFAGETLFDPNSLDSIAIDGSDVIGRPQIQRGAREPIYTMYYVRPAVTAMQGDKGGQQLWDQLIQPVVDEFPDSPSYIRIFGVRVLSHQLRYAPILAEDDNTWASEAEFIRHCVAYSCLLREWNYRNPVMYSGSYLCKGRTSFRAGMRLLDTTKNREFYVHTVHHNMQLGARPMYTTTLGVTRGWDVRAGVR